VCSPRASRSPGAARQRGVAPGALLRCALLSLLAGGLAGCHLAVLHPAGPIGDAERTILFDALIIMLAIVVPTILATLFVAWRFRASNTRAPYWPTWAHSGRIEIITWSIPLLVIMFLGGIAWIGSHLLDPAAPIDSRAKPLEVDVVSLDWNWLFIYPQENLASVNTLVVPAGVPLDLHITSATVWNTFFVPRLGTMIYAMYGMQSRLHLQADAPGTYYGLSTMVDGDGFPDMHFDCRALPPGEFASWVSGVHGGTGTMLDAATYRQLLKPTRHAKPYTYRAVEPGLFQQILLQTLPPGGG
jgi:cytochrome o ubiquinol oxidase subunit II